MAGKEKVPDDRGEKSMNLDIRKFLKNQALVGSFRILLLHFIAIKHLVVELIKKINWYLQHFVKLHSNLQTQLNFSWFE